MTQEIEQVDFSEEMRASFRQYGAAVNFGRSFPNVVDGMKPVHRRILWAMWRMGARPGRPRVKSARAASETTGSFHPHGDASAYQTMVGLAQDFSQVIPFIDPQGNWGSLSYPAAAPRYTECRLTQAAAAMLGLLPDATSTVPEVDEDAVELVPNYSGEFLEPVTLPALIPSFVVNGYDGGIGLGIGGQAPGHNLNEVLDLAAYMLDNPNMRNETALARVPGPDLPCDCDIFDTDDGGISSYLTTGSGSFVMRARWTVEEYPINRARNGHRIIVTGLPFKMSPEKVLEGITKMVTTELLPQDITAINATGAAGIRIIIDCVENDTDDVIQRLLYHSRQSGMQQSFSVNMTAIVNGTIRVVGVIDAVRHWLRHRRASIRRRSEFRRDKALRRLHLVEGYIKVVPIAQEVVEVVRTSANRADASLTMQSRWGFSEEQATAILDMTIGQITRLGVDRFVAEAAQLQEIIDTCTQLLTDDDALRTEMKSEMRSIRKAFGRDRRCVLRTGESPYVQRPEAPAVEIPVVNGYLAITGRNWVRWVQRAQFSRMTEADYVTDLIPVTNLNRIDMISNLGWHNRLSMEAVPKTLTNSKALFSAMLDPGEGVVMVGSAAPYGPGTDIVMVTTFGALKRIEWDEWTSHREGKPYQMIGLNEGEEIASAFFLPPGKEIAVVTAWGNLLRMDPDDLAAKGRGAKGIAGVVLAADNDSVVWAGAVSPEDRLVYWTDEDRFGYFSVGDVRRSNRGTKGRAFTKSERLVIGVTTVAEGEDISLRWYHGTMDEPASIPLGSEPQTGLTDSDMETAKGIKSASAVWTEQV